jgi:hypothetical protein
MVPMVTNRQPSRESCATVTVPFLSENAASTALSSSAGQWYVRGSTTGRVLKRRRQDSTVAGWVMVADPRRTSGGGSLRPRYRQTIIFTALRLVSDDLKYGPPRWTRRSGGQRPLAKWASIALDASSTVESVDKGVAGSLYAVENSLGLESAPGWEPDPEPPQPAQKAPTRRTSRLIRAAPNIMASAYHIFVWRCANHASMTVTFDPRSAACTRPSPIVSRMALLGSDAGLAKSTDGLDAVDSVGMDHFGILKSAPIHR